VATDIGSLVLPLAPMLITFMGNDDSWPDGNNPWKRMILLDIKKLYFRLLIEKFVCYFCICHG
jgi:hypothetical protein